MSVAVKAREELGCQEEEDLNVYNADHKSRERRVSTDLRPKIEIFNYTEFREQSFVEWS